MQTFILFLLYDYIICKKKTWESGDATNVTYVFIFIPDMQQSKGTWRSNKGKWGRQYETQTHNTSIHV